MGGLQRKGGQRKEERLGPGKRSGPCKKKARERHIEFIVKEAKLFFHDVNTGEC